MEGIRSEFLSIIQEFRLFRDQVNSDTRDYREFKGKVSEKQDAHEKRIKTVEDRLLLLLITVIATLLTGFMNMAVLLSRGSS